MRLIKNLLSLAMLLAIAMPLLAQQPTLPKNSDGFYEISNESSYEVFRQIVATGNPYANAVLTADIKVYNAIGGGDEQFHYRGTFDGQGHTVTLFDSSNEDLNNAATSGLFEYTKPGCIIRNLRLVGNMTTLTKDVECMGSIVCDATGTIIENCISEVNIGGFAKCRGGLIGVARGECMIENCGYIGLLASGDIASGLVGKNTQSLSIKSCYSAPYYSQYYDSEKGYVFTNGMPNHETCLNNYYCSTRHHDGLSMENQSGIELTPGEIANGKLCYLLNQGGKKGVVWYQHGDYPYPFKGTDGVMITSPDNGTTFQASASCSHDTRNVCKHCGFLNYDVEPLQATGSILIKEENVPSYYGNYIDNVVYSFDLNSNTATVRGVYLPDDPSDEPAFTGVKAIHIPESLKIVVNDYGDVQEVKVVSIAANAFKDNQALEYCYIPKTVTAIGEGAFSGCTNLKYLHFADGSGTAEQAPISLSLDFVENCTGLKKLYFGREMSWEVSDCIQSGGFLDEEGGGYAWYKSPFMTNVNTSEIYLGPSIARFSNVGNSDINQYHEFHAGNYEIDLKVCIMGDDSSLGTDLALGGFTDLTSSDYIYVNRSITEKFLHGNSFIGMGLYDECNSVTFGPYVKYIADRAFSGALWGQIKNVDLEKAYNLEEIGEKAFISCPFITSLNFSTTKLKKIGKEAFFGSSVKSVAFGDSLTNISEGCFAECEKLEGVYVPSSVTSIGKDAFAKCTSLNRVIFDDSDTELELKDQQFFGCGNIGNVYMGRNLSLDTNNTTNDKYSFKPKSGSTWSIGPEVTRIPSNLFVHSKYDGVTFNYSAQPLHFNDYLNCTANVISLDRDLICDTYNKPALPFAKANNKDIECINIGGNIRLIPAGMFEGCSKVTYIMIPDNIWKIGENAFKGCSAANIVCIMGSPYVDLSAFENCSSMSYLYLMGGEIQIDDRAFYNCNIKEIIPIFTTDPEKKSSEFAFDDYEYANTNLAVNDAVFNEAPWSKFKKKSNGVVTNIYETGSEQNPDNKYERASLPHTFTKDRFDLVYVPFDMDSYYFGADAEIYHLPKINGSEFKENITTNDAATYDIDNIVVNKVNIDYNNRLDKGETYLVKSKHEENSLGAYYNFFDAAYTTVSNEPTAVQGQQSNATLHEGDVSLSDAESGGVYVFDEGVIKLLNGDFEYERGKAHLHAASADGKQFVFNFKGVDSTERTAVFMTSKTDLSFNKYLDGYSSFYAADYNYIAPAWCEVYVVTSSQGNYVTTVKIEDNIINKGEAVLIKTSNKDANELTEYLTFATNGSTDPAYGSNLLKGVRDNTPVSDLGCDYVYVLSCNSETLNNVGFYKYSAGKILPAGKAYLDPSSLPAQQLANACLFLDDSAASGISSVPAADSNAMGGVYDLMGRRLKEAGYKGTYIINGKKVIIK